MGAASAALIIVVDEKAAPVGSGFFCGLPYFVAYATNYFPKTLVLSESACTFEASTATNHPATMNLAATFAQVAITPQGRAFAAALAANDEMRAQRAFQAMTNLLPQRAAGSMALETAAERKAAGAVYLATWGQYENMAKHPAFADCDLPAEKCLKLLAVAAGVDLPEPCHKCGGTGNLPQYHYNAQGTCFACDGTGRA